MLLQLKLSMEFVFHPQLLHNTIYYEKSYIFAFFICLYTERGKWFTALFSQDGYSSSLPAPSLKKREREHSHPTL